VPARAGHDAKGYLRQRETRGAGGIDEIRSGSDLAAAATIGRAVDGREQRDSGMPSTRATMRSKIRLLLRPPAFVGHAVCAP